MKLKKCNKIALLRQPSGAATEHMQVMSQNLVKTAFGERLKNRDSSSRCNNKGEPASYESPEQRKLGHPLFFLLWNSEMT